MQPSGNPQQRNNFPLAQLSRPIRRYRLYHSLSAPISPDKEIRSAATVLQMAVRYLHVCMFYFTWNFMSKLFVVSLLEIDTHFHVYL